MNFKLTGEMDLLNGQQMVSRTIAKQWTFIRAMTLTNTGRDLAKAFNSRRKTKGARLSKNQKARVSRATKKNLVATVGVGKAGLRGKKIRSIGKNTKTITRAEVPTVLAQRFYGNKLFQPKKTYLTGLWVRQTKERKSILRMYRIVEKQKYISTKPSLLLYALAKRIVPRRLPVNLKRSIEYAQRKPKAA